MPAQHKMASLCSNSQKPGAMDMFRAMPASLILTTHKQYNNAPTDKNKHFASKGWFVAVYQLKNFGSVVS